MHTYEYGHVRLSVTMATKLHLFGILAYCNRPSIYCLAHAGLPTTKVMLCLITGYAARSWRRDSPPPPAVLRQEGADSFLLLCMKSQSM